jgi:RNA polymerase sigma factor (sigma-70 family)
VSLRDRRSQAGSRLRLRLATDDRLVRFVRGGDPIAFEVLYDRHAGALLSFCLYMLGSRRDAEDAVQATFASAHGSLLADERPVTLRPWLFAIARNASVSILRARHPEVELNGEPARGGDPVRELELHEDVRQLVEGLLALPERQRAALVLAELHGLSQAEIAEVMGVRSEQVKAYAYQARSNLISERDARDALCLDIREELASARGAGLLKSRLRRHVRSCQGCREYQDELARQRRQFGVLLPVAPSLALKYRTLEDLICNASLSGPRAGTVAVGGAMAGGAALADGGLKALIAKVGVGLAAVGATAGVGASVLSLPAPSETHSSPQSLQEQPSGLRLTASAGAPASRGTGESSSGVRGRLHHGRGGAPGGRGGRSPAAPRQPASLTTGSGTSPQPSVGEPGGESGGEAPQSAGSSTGPSPGKAGLHAGRSPGGRRQQTSERQQKITENQRKSEEQQQRGALERLQQREEHELKAEEHQQRSEERRQRSEEHKPEGFRPPPGERRARREQRRAQREKRRAEQEERETQTTE